METWRQYRIQSHRGVNVRGSLTCKGVKCKAWPTEAQFTKSTGDGECTQRRWVGKRPGDISEVNEICVEE